MKQTAVDWLMEQITYDNGFGQRRNSFSEFCDLSAYFEEAKKIEKRQIKDAFVVRYTGTAEEYYNETYNTTER